MHMQLIDWLVMLIPLLIILFIAIKTYGYTTSVADFMAANRVAGRYLLATVVGEASSGVIGQLAGFEMFFVAGFTMGWWSKLTTPVGLLIGLTGFVMYRYRQSRVMTLAQFFEVRYSKNFRIFAGILAFTAGIVNFGVFPATGARFFVYYCGLPQNLVIGSLTIPTFGLLMIVFMSVALFLTVTGGQLTIMVVDCIEGLISGLFYLIVIFTLLRMFQWSQISQALSTAPPHQSMLNPFDIGSTQDFNIWYVLIGVIGGIYSTGSWQGSAGFRASALNPHEAKMGGILGKWRDSSKSLMFTLLAICAFTYLKHADFAASATHVYASLNNIEDPQIRNQMRVPVALAYLLPAGVKGMLASIMLFAMMAGDGIYMHSWGSILVQDVILPFRKKPFEPREHLLLLRLAIVGVAVFAFIFGILYKPTEYIFMFFQLTGAIFSGAGAAIIGGLYWKRGTTPAAWASLIAGSSLAVCGIVLQQGNVWPGMVAPWLVQQFPDIPYLNAHLTKFPLNGQYVLAIAQITSVVLYVTISLLTCRENFNMDRMLHRGEYALDHKAGVKPVEKTKFTFGKLIGIDPEFTRGDKIISYSVFGWSMLWFFVFVVCSIWYVIRPWPLQWWANYWHICVLLIPLPIGIITTVWFTWGGISDLRKAFVLIKSSNRNLLDDGMVINHRNLGDVEKHGDDKKSIPLPVNYRV